MAVVYVRSVEFGNKIVGDLGKNLNLAGLHLVGKMRRNVNRGQKYQRIVGRNGVYYKGLKPSKPGEFPKKLTGQLQRSITYNVSPVRLVLRVGSALDYAGFMQTGTRHMRPRPWVTMTWQREKDRVTRIILRRR